MILKGIKRKVAAGVLAGMVVVGVAASPALAASTTTTDVFNRYVSSESTPGAVIAGDDNSGIIWKYGDLNNIETNKIQVYVELQDTKPDGKGAIAVARQYNDKGTYVGQYTFHNTKGSGTTLKESHFFSGSLSTNAADSGGITIQVCNGTSSGTPINCTSAHGPFHAY